MEWSSPKSTAILVRDKLERISEKVRSKKRKLAPVNLDDRYDQNGQLLPCWTSAFVEDDEGGSEYAEKSYDIDKLLASDDSSDEDAKYDESGSWKEEKKPVTAAAAPVFLPPSRSVLRKKPVNLNQTILHPHKLQSSSTSTKKTSKGDEVIVIEDAAGEEAGYHEYPPLPLGLEKTRGQQKKKKKSVHGDKQPTTLGTDFRVKVTIDAQKFVIPCTRHALVSWLMTETAKRYYDETGLSVVVSALRTTDGGKLSVHDTLWPSLRDDDEVTAIVERSTATSLLECYRQMCFNVQCAIHTNIVNVLQSASDASELELTGLGLGDEEVIPVLKALQFYTGVTAIDLSRNAIGDLSISPLCKVLPGLTSLQRMNFSSNEITGSSFPLLLQTLSSSTTTAAPPPLTSLDISLNYPMDSSVPSLVQFLSKAYTLTNLNLASCGLTPLGLQKLIPGLASCPSLTSLSIADNPVLCNFPENNFQTTEKLLDDLTKVSTLQSLDISATGLNTSLRMVSKLIESTSLTALDLSSNRLTSGTDQFSSALISAKNLMSLNLAVCGLTAEEGAAIATGLKSNQSLHSLILKGNQLGEAAHTLATALSINKTLQELDVSSCSLDIVHAQHMIESIRSNDNSAIKVLNMARNRLEGALEVGAEVISGMIRMDLSGNNLTQASKYSIASSWKSCHSASGISLDHRGNAFVLQAQTITTRNADLYDDSLYSQS